MFDKQLSPDDVTYEVARQLLNRRIGQLLERSQACTDPADRRRLAAERSEIVRRRDRLMPGAHEARRIVEEATAARESSDARGEPG